MYIVNPFLLVVCVAVIGAGVLGTTFAFRRGNALLAAFIGGIAGTAGTLSFMAPLNFCTFEADRGFWDVVIGAGLIAASSGALLWLAFWILDRSARGLNVIPQADSHPGAFNGRRAWIGAVFCLLPTVGLLAVFSYTPMVNTFRFSTLLARFGTQRTAFVCVDNFSRLITDSDYIRILGVSLFLAAAIVIVGLSFALLIASMASQPVRGARIYRTLLIWPYAVSPIIAGELFEMLLTREVGVVNTMLGLDVPWLVEPTMARWSLVVASAWNLIGFNILFYIAGLQNVPDDVQEAAAIDGANAIQRFFYVTFPLLSPFTFFLVVTNTIYALFETFGMIDVLTQGGPLRSTYTAMYNVFKIGIEGQDLGKATAQSLVLLVIVVAITIIQFRVSRDRISYTV